MENMDFEKLRHYTIITGYKACNGDMNEYLKDLKKNRIKSFEHLEGDMIDKELSQIDFNAGMITLAACIFRNKLSSEDFELLGESLIDLGKELKGISKLV